MIRVGEQVVVAINDGRASLRFTRRADHPDRINVFVLNCDTETAASILPPVPVASGWLSLSAIRALKEAL